MIAFSLYTSQIVLDELNEGEVAKAAERMTLMTAVPVLVLNDQIGDLAEEIVLRGILPDIALRDAIHISCAAVHRLDFLLTWNCRHIANPFIQGRIRACFSAHGIEVPLICTPEEFIGDADSTPDSDSADG